MTFDVHEPRGKDGRWVHFPTIHLGDLSTPDARRSPEVSAEQFQKHAQRGAAKVARLKGAATEPKALTDSKSWDNIVSMAYKASREPWGGETIDAHTGKTVAADANAYALTVRDPGMSTVSVKPGASEAEFRKAMEEARSKYKDILSRPGSHLGVFHDQDVNRIDIDPVMVTPNLSDVHDIGAFTHAVGGAYHFKSGDGYWPPHVKEPSKTKATKKEPAMTSLAFQTPSLHTADFDLSRKDGKLAFWKQILPKKSIDYTAKDGSRRTLDFTEEYLTDLANNKAVDKIGFLLADVDNRHTMDPERWRGEVEAMEVRDDGLYGKVVFPSPEAAKAVLDNPDLGVSARIREGVQRSDGSTVNRGIIHVLGTLDPQVSGMSGWQTADLSTEQDEVLDLSNEEYKDMSDKKTEPRDLSEFTEADIDKMTDEELDEFLATYAPEFGAVESDKSEDESEDETEDEDHEDEDKADADKAKELVGAGADMSGKSTEDIELANQQVATANARAAEALRRVAEAEWREERNGFLGEGVPPHALDLAAPVLNRADDMVIDLSNAGEDDVNVSEVVRGLLDALKGSVDLSNEEGHNGTLDLSNGEDPDKELLDAWDEQF